LPRIPRAELEQGFAWLQSVVSHVTGQPIEPFMKANLLEPFGMVTSGYVTTV
jgi:CubicO group peptidase (beta-lactamase class C family)